MIAASVMHSWAIIVGMGGVAYSVWRIGRGER
jgi:hypothetical protein